MESRAVFLLSELFSSFQSVFCARTGKGRESSVWGEGFLHLHGSPSVTHPMAAVLLSPSLLVLEPWYKDSLAGKGEALGFM